MGGLVAGHEGKANSCPEMDAVVGEHAIRQQ